MFRQKLLQTLVIGMIGVVFLFAFLSGCSSNKETVEDKKLPIAEEGAQTDKTANASQTNADYSDPNNFDYGTLKFTLQEDHKNNPLSVKYTSTPYITKNKQYTANSNLSNIANKAQFGSFTSEQKKLLNKNGFFATASGDEQLFYTYENNQYMKIPSFVSTDSVLQVYNVFFDFSLRTLESETLLTKLEKLTDSMMKKSIGLYESVTNSVVKDATLRNAAYFAVGQKLLQKPLPANLPKEAISMVEKELALIKAGEHFQKSVIFNCKIDYSQYTPRGHYTRSDGLKKYFMAMMWYGQAPFLLFKPDTQEKELNLQTAIQGLIISYELYNNNDIQSDIHLWEDIYNPTEFYVGKSDDLNVYDFKNLLMQVYGKNIDMEKLADKDNLEALIIEGRKLPEPKIQGKWESVEIPVGKQFRFMGQRYIPDSEILQTLSVPYIRPFPKGLDVMGVLGSARAKDLLLNYYKENTNWKGYTKTFDKLNKLFNDLSKETWQSNMYYGWLWSLNPIIKSFGAGYPSFMRNLAWEDKSLNTALGSWSELRHDTILYAKQSGAECGGGEAPPVIKGYVEPNVEFYNRLLWLTQFSRKNLADRDILSGELESKIQSLEDLLTFLINCSVKELRNEELTKQEYNQLLIYGGTLEYLSTSLAGGYKGWYEITSDTDRNMAVIADVHSTSNSCLEVGVGTADQIFVVVPIGGKLYLTRGSIFSYYEFVNDARLTDEAWQKMLKNNKQPNQPDWTKSYRNGKNKIIPKPAKPYSSGC